MLTSDSAEHSTMDVLVENSNLGEMPCEKEDGECKYHSDIKLQRSHLVGCQDWLWEAV